MDGQLLHQLRLAAGAAGKTLHSLRRWTRIYRLWFLTSGPRPLDIAANISGLASAAQITADGVTESQRAAADLARLSTTLHELVSHFRH